MKTNVIDLNLHNEAHIAASQKLVSFMLGGLQWPVEDAKRLADWLAANDCVDQATDLRRIITNAECVR